MSRQDRKTLKNFFSDGSLPTSQHYGDLVDSMVTWKDDGFDKDIQLGWRIAASGEKGSLMSFYSGVGAPEPDWTMALGKSDGKLHYRRQVQGVVNPGLSMDPYGRIGLNTESPAWRLDVNGVARMRGRIGVPKDEEATVPADGKWHDVTPVLDGCQALEGVAGVGGEKYKGHYSLLHAIGVNTYNPRNWFLNWLFKRKQIRAQTAVFGRYGDRLKLRWRTVTDQEKLKRAREENAGRDAQEFYRPYTLQIRTSSNYGENFKIRYYVTKLWFDSSMTGSRPGGKDRDPGAL